MSEKWPTFDDAIERVRSRNKMSIGSAQVWLRTKCKSREIRSYTIPADGVAGEYGLTVTLISNDDLLYELDQQSAQPSKAKPTAKSKEHRYRYPDDAKLVKKGRKLVKDGVSKTEAARRLAPKAIGGNLDQRIARLRRLF